MNKRQLVYHHNWCLMTMNDKLKDALAFGKVVEVFPTKAGIRRLNDKIKALILRELGEEEY